MSLTVDTKHAQTEKGTAALTYGSQGIKLLLEMCTSHFFAKRSVEIIKFFTKRWGLQVSELDAI